MRKILIVIVLMSTCLLAQSGVVKVTLKNGTTITGNLVAMNPTGNVVLQIGGENLSFAMSEVASIDDYQLSVSNVKENKENSIYNKPGTYEFLDHADYPDSIFVTVGGQKFTMVLVRGGWFNMGFNGRHSWSYRSEPVHKVNLSSFYISKDYITKSAFNNIIGKKSSNSSNDPIKLHHFEIAQVRIFFGSLRVYYRLPTESEWEYAAISKNAKYIFRQNDCKEWCSDYFDVFHSGEQTNPSGPETGISNVFRCYYNDNKKWKRYDSESGYLRIAIDAKLLVNRINNNKKDILF